MDKRKEVTRVRVGISILFWLVFLAFFGYSFLTIMNLEELADPRRHRQFFRILTALSQPNLFEAEIYREVTKGMLKTVQMAFLATTMSAIIAIPLTFFSARPSSCWGRVCNTILQFILSAIRAVHPMIIVIPAAFLAGIGPAAGVLALTLFSTAVLTGIFSEYAQQHPSLSWMNLFKVYFPGLAFKHLPVNILIATILGFAGGGGIGFFIQQNFNLLNYHDGSAAILACIFVIGGLDLIARAVWHKIQNHRIAVSLDHEASRLD